jgi:RHS repeat-associated protein
MAASTVPGITSPDIRQWPKPIVVWQHAGQSGQFHAQVDLIRGVGRAGAIPDLALTYDGGGHSGIFGIGWSLSIPSFSRGNGRQLPRYRDAGPDADKFLSSEFGELVPVRVERAGDWITDTRHASGVQITRFRARVDTHFVRIERHTALASGEIHWRSISRDNVTRVYGRTDRARIADPLHPTRIARWLLEEQSDSRGNHILFEYKPEDLAGVPASSLPERHRLDSAMGDAQRHPKRIKWGNRRPHEAGEWLFELVFDYGEHDGDSLDETSHWSLRPDASSEYRTGFDVRTRRLCRRALLFYHMSELGDSPAVVRAHSFTYETTPAASLLAGVSLQGYRRQHDGAVASESLPEVRFAYTSEVPPGQRPAGAGTAAVRDIVFADGRFAASSGATLEWHDLEGAGLPGLVNRTNSGTLHYRKNLGSGRLGHPEALPSRPALTDTGSPAAQSIGKPFGDGRSCLIDLLEGPGYQERLRSGAWLPYTTFSHSPSVRASIAGTRNLDLDGDGRGDLLLAGELGVRWHKFTGREGWTAAQDVAFGPSAQTALADRTGTVLLADMTGDGLADLVQVRPGNVRYWPNLGYGRFGEPVQMAGSPLLDGPDLFDPARVRLVDVNGSGTADLVYLGRQAVSCYLNRCGNSFGSAHAILNLPAVTDLESIDVVDLLGTGTGCLVWSSISPGRIDAPLRYIELVGGQRPHLLASIENGYGLRVEISYAPSTRLMLADRQAGHVWHSTLPSPVWLATEVRETDLIAGVAQVVSWSFRHGSYDDAEREMCGFAYVERREWQLVPAPPGGPPFEERIPERLTRSWYHTGVHADGMQLESRLAADFYDGDPHGTARPGLSVENEAGVPPRELLRALRGRPIREEVFASQDGERETQPYSTTDYGYRLSGLQPPASTAPPAVAVFVQEAIERTYERNTDPRVTHRLVLEVDRLGNPTRQATIAYPRRRPEQPEQGRTLVTVEEQDVINRDDAPDWFRAGVPSATRVFEVGSLPAPASEELFRTDELRSLLAAPGLVDVPFEQSLAVSGPTRRRLISATKTSYWNDELTAPALDGTVSRLALVYEQRRAAFTAGLLSTAFGDGAVQPELLETAGYENADGLWWARGSRITYSRAAFYQPLTERRPLSAEYSVAYDPNGLFVEETRDPVGNVVRARYDYHALAAATVTDPNGATVGTSFDAFGLPIAVAVAGAREEGDSLIAPTINVARDLLSWERERTASSLRVSERVRHGDPTSPWEHTISFLDGRGREMQSKRLAEPESGTTADRWVVERYAVMTATGTTVRAYAPGFTADDRFAAESGVASFPVTRFRLDALGRAVETQHAGGALARKIHTAWRVEHWDANDAVRGSLWLQTRLRPGATAQETAEAEAADNHRDTPTLEHLDPAGRPFLQVKDGGAAGLAETRTALTIDGKVTAVIDARRVLTEQSTYDMVGRPMRVHGAASGTTRTFHNAEGQPVYAWRARGQEHRLFYDSAGRQIRREVRARDGAWRVAERLVWGEQAPEGSAYQRSRLYLHYDGAGQLKIPSYDFQGRPLRTERVFRRDLTVASDWSRLRSAERAEDVERAALPLLADESTFVTVATYDGQGRLVTRATPDASVTRVEYNPRGLPARITVTVDGRPTEVLHAPVYDAAGRRVDARLGNGVRETSSYHDGTGFLIGRTTTALGGGVLRDLTFSRDAVGNVLAVADAGQQTLYFRNAVIAPGRGFRYDALYRLIEADGREAAIPNPPPDRPSVPPVHQIPHVNDRAAVRSYTEHYSYDLAGNMTELVHSAGSEGSWTVRYDIDPRADRITGLRQRDGTSIPGRFDYDDAGNALTLGGLTGLTWSDDEQLVEVELEGGGTAYYAYDAAGGRGAKAIVRLDGQREERYYVDGYESYRRLASTGDVDREETLLHVEDGEGRLLLIERRRTAGERDWTTLWRYQHADQVGSCTLETDQEVRLLTFEEFRPYGTTAYHAGQPGILPKRHRFGGRENDTETGLNYQGARYYAPWLCRWITPDPMGMEDGTNRYAFAMGNPVTWSDSTGTHVDSEDSARRWRESRGGWGSPEWNAYVAERFPAPNQEVLTFPDENIHPVRRPRHVPHRLSDHQRSRPRHITSGGPRPTASVVPPTVAVEASPLNATRPTRSLPQIELRPDIALTADLPELYSGLGPSADLRAHSTGDERTFWSMGGGNLVLGTLAAIGGFAAVAVAAPLIATAGGLALAAAAVGAVAGGLGAAGGVVLAVGGGLQLLTSDSRTAAEDEQLNRAFDMTQSIASFGGQTALLAAVATGTGEREAENYVEIGSAAEGVINLVQGAFTLARGGYRAARGAHRLYRSWRDARAVEEQLNRVGDLAGSSERLGALPQGAGDNWDADLLYPGHTGDLAEPSHFRDFQRELDRLRDASGVPINVEYGPVRGPVVTASGFRGHPATTFERTPSLLITLPDREIAPGVRLITPGTLTDEFMHVWNKMHGSGAYLPPEAASVHRFLANRVAELGDTELLGVPLNMAYHKLELLNFLQARRGQGLPSFVIASGRIPGTPGIAGARLQQWANNYAHDIRRSGALELMP